MDQRQAAHTVVETITAMAQTGVPLMLRVLPAADLQFWDHYPDNDARDRLTRSRWYYHVHALGDRAPEEHGHFHLFLHRTQLGDPATFTRAPHLGEDAPAHVTHIAGLAINHAGIPVSWFATNRWVTDEFFYSAPVMTAHLDCYNVDQTAEDPLVNRLLTAMVALYRDELADLLQARDAALAALIVAEGPSASEAGHAVLASIPIDLDAKIDSLGL
jgi:hypothetical protein